MTLLSAADNTHAPCLQPCPVCDGSFFPSLMKEMSVVVGYAIINAIAMRKILKKYDKIHESKQGEAFRSQVQSMHMEILQSPWLCELIAFHINLRESKTAIKMGSEMFFEGCSLIFNDEKPSLSCELSDTVKFEIDLTCSICLLLNQDTVFDAVYLSCGHIFCFMCACKSGSVTIVDGLTTIKPTAKCPLCRRCPKYWEERLQIERVERIRQTKEHWESQSRAFLGI